MLSLLNKIISSNDLQLQYNKVNSQYNYLTFECSKCNHSNWLIHGYYKRKVIIHRYIYEVDVIRVKGSCGITHVLLPCFIISFNLNSIKDILYYLKIKTDDIIQPIFSKVRNHSLIFLHST